MQRVIFMEKPEFKKCSIPGVSLQQMTIVESMWVVVAKWSKAFDW